MLTYLSAYPTAAVEIATPLLRLAMTAVIGGWFHFARVRRFRQRILRNAGNGVPCG